MGKENIQFQVGDILDGKVSGITKFGAFVTLPGGKSGLVHISEIANTFVNDVHEHVSEGQEVKVKVIGLNDGKINLSMKKAVETPPASRSSAPRTSAPRQSSSRQSGYASMQQVAPVSSNASFEDKLKQFMQASDSRISDSKLYAEKKQRRRGRGD